MKWNFADRHIRLNLIGTIILLVGLASAVLIYRAAENDRDEVLGYETWNGSAYPILPDDSQKYLRDLELYGGKANVLADKFRRWFEGLWRGESLAFSIAFVTIALSAAIFYAANHSSPLEGNTRAANNQSDPPK
jgi:hypothetical protein